MKKLVLISVITAAVLALTGCNQTVHGGGVVNVVDGWVVISGEQRPLVHGAAHFALTAMCNDRKDGVMTTLMWNDQTNGIQFTARLPWTPVAELGDAQITTCEELAAYADEVLGVFRGSVAGAYINAQGQEVAQVVVEVTQPGQGIVTDGPEAVDLCGGTASNVMVSTAGSGTPTTGDTIPATENTIPEFVAAGCLDKGSLVFQ